MHPISRREVLTGISISFGAALTAGCTAHLEQTRGTIELQNFSAEPVIFTVATERAEKPDDQQTPIFRTQYHGFPEESVVLPNAISGDEHRVSILVHKETEGEPGTVIAHGKSTFTPNTQEPTLYVRFEFRDSRTITFESGQ